MPGSAAQPARPSRRRRESFVGLAEEDVEKRGADFQRPDVLDLFDFGFGFRDGSGTGSPRAPPAPVTAFGGPFGGEIGGEIDNRLGDQLSDRLDNRYRAQGLQDCAARRWVHQHRPLPRQAWTGWRWPRPPFGERRTGGAAAQVEVQAQRRLVTASEAALARPAPWVR